MKRRYNSYGNDQRYKSRGRYNQRDRYNRGYHGYDQDDIYRDSYRDFEDTMTGKIVNRMTQQQAGHEAQDKQAKKAPRVTICNNRKYKDSKKRGRYRNLRTGEVVNVG